MPNTGETAVKEQGKPCPYVLGTDIPVGQEKQWTKKHISGGINITDKNEAECEMRLVAFWVKIIRTALTAYTLPQRWGSDILMEKGKEREWVQWMTGEQAFQAGGPEGQSLGGGLAPGVRVWPGQWAEWAKERLAADGVREKVL